MVPPPTANNLDLTQQTTTYGRKIQESQGRSLNWESVRSNATPTPIGNPSVLQQLLGNWIPFPPTSSSGTTTASKESKKTTPWPSPVRVPPVLYSGAQRAQVKATGLGKKQETTAISKIQAQNGGTDTVEKTVYSSTSSPDKLE